MRQLRHPAIIALALVLLFPAAGRAGEAGDADFDPAEFAGEFRRHCVQVHVFGKSDDGQTPTVGDFAADIANARATLFGGYWWDAQTVLVGDPGIDDRFIHAVEIGLPGGEERWPARVKGRFHRLQAVLLEVLPNEEGGYPAAAPLRFGVVPYTDDHIVATYGWKGGEWRLSLDGAVGSPAYNDAGAETADVDAEGIIVDEDGTPVGAAFGSEVAFAAGDMYWFGRGLLNARVVSADEYRDLHEALRDRLLDTVLETRLRLRTDLEEAETAWSGFGDDGVDESTYEVRLPGLAVGPRHLFIPANLGAANIARIEEIETQLPSGRVVKAEFIGACRDYMAIVAETEEDLPGKPPAGFSFLNPLVVPEEAFLPGEEFLALPDKGLFLRWHIDYNLGRRRERQDHDRWRGTFRGYRGEPVVSTLTNEEEGSLAFDLDGKLIAIALAPRVPHTDTMGEVYGGAGFRPLGFVHEALTKPGSFDPTLMPTDAENGKRLIGIGVEWQGMDANSARLFGAEKATRGGDIGLLISHVYPDSQAAAMGLKEQDILLRLFVQGRSEPIELVPSSDHMAGFSLLDLEDISVESVQRFMGELSPPWPSRENTLTTTLTSIGMGRQIRLEYLREGEIRHVDFVTGFLPSDYRSAPRFKMDSLGMTVKPITYEVVRYFRRDPDTGGVIVYKVEEGGRGNVAGLYPYLLITRVNGFAVDDFDDFKNKVEPFENGADQSIELTVEGFGKTRLIKIEK